MSRRIMHVFMADGIGGWDVGGKSLGRVLARCHPETHYHLVRWGHGWGRWYADLSRPQHTRRRGAELATDVQRVIQDHPDEPIVLIGKSGGTAVIAAALESLPEHSVDRVILIASALSPEYDLTAAIRAVSGSLIAWHSRADLIFLGLGTLLFKTIDRHRSVGAGLVGFRGVAVENPKFRSLGWNPRMIRQGHWGGHMAQDTTWFYEQFILPWLRIDEPTDVE